jgi:hypothetical protein
MHRSALLVVLATAACSSVCPTSAVLTGLDGGVQACVQSTDCPRPSGVLVCSDTFDESRDCVACVDTQCERFTPGACK